MVKSFVTDAIQARDSEALELNVALNEMRSTAANCVGEWLHPPVRAGGGFTSVSQTGLASVAGVKLPVNDRCGRRQSAENLHMPTRSRHFLNNNQGGSSC